MFLPQWSQTRNRQANDAQNPIALHCGSKSRTRDHAVDEADFVIGRLVLMRGPSHSDARNFRLEVWACDRKSVEFTKL